jgi:4-amino-4-deoxy-L-arabinose transferase-like glycosyltransferase
VVLNGSRDPARDTGAAALFGAALLLLAAMLVRQLVVDAPLGHDEAIYATGGRELVTGAPPSGYGLHRSIGMKAVAAIGVMAGSSGWALRAVVVLASLGFLLAYRALGARAFGRWPAAWAAAAMVTSFGFQRRGAEILSDVPALLLLVLVLLVFVRELGGRAEGGRPGPGFLVVAPLAAAAFYLRYGLSTSVVAIGVAAAAVWWRPLVAGRRTVLATFALFALLLLPHILHSVGETGSPLGILQVSGDAAHRDYLGQGLVQFPRVFALEGGPVLLVLFVIGAVAGARALRRLRLARRHARPPAEERVVAFLWLASVFHILVTGLLAHAEFRYFFFGVAGLTLIGAASACQWASGRRRLGVAAALALLAVALVTHQVNIQRYARVSRMRQVLVDASAEVRRLSGAESCSALSRHAPHIGWYSGCAASWMGGRAPAAASGARFLVLFAREPGGAKVRERLSRSHRLTEVAGVADPAAFYGDAAIYQLR